MEILNIWIQASVSFLRRRMPFDLLGNCFGAFSRQAWQVDRGQLNIESTTAEPGLNFGIEVCAESIPKFERLGANKPNQAKEQNQVCPDSRVVKRDKRSPVFFCKIKAAGKVETKKQNGKHWNFLRKFDRTTIG
jgi:hypothetical protein